MNETTVTTPNELEIRVERTFDAPRAHVFSIWTDPKLIPEWWGDGTVVEEMDVRAGGTYRFRTAYGVVEGEFREVDPPERLVQTFQNHLQTLEFEDLGDQTKLTQTMRFATTEERDTTMQYGVEEGAKGGFARIDAVLQRLRSTRPASRDAQRRTSTSACSSSKTSGGRIFRTSSLGPVRPMRTPSLADRVDDRPSPARGSSSSTPTSSPRPRTATISSCRSAARPSRRSSSSPTRFTCGDDPLVPDHVEHRERRPAPRPGCRRRC